MSEFTPIVGLPKSIIDFVNQNEQIKDQIIKESAQQQERQDAKKTQTKKTLTLALIFGAIRKLTINKVLKNNLLSQLRSLIFVERMNLEMNAQMRRRNRALAEELEEEENEDIEAEEARLKRQREQEELEARQRELLSEQAYEAGVYLGNISMLIADNMKGVKNFTPLKKEDCDKLRNLILGSKFDLNSENFFENLTSEIGKVIDGAFDRAREELAKLNATGNLSDEHLKHNRGVLDSCQKCITQQLINKLITNTIGDNDIGNTRIALNKFAGAAFKDSAASHTATKDSSIGMPSPPAQSQRQVQNQDKNLDKDQSTPSKPKQKFWDVPKGAPKPKPPIE